MEMVLPYLEAIGGFMRLYWFFCLGYLILVNLLAYWMYALDKKYAKKRAWRIPEASLIGIALFGGSVGAYIAMQLHRHKTKHKRFTVTVPLAMIVQIAFVALCLFV